MSRRKYDGRLFHTRGPTAVKLLSPYVLYCGCWVRRKSTANLRRRRSLLATRLISSVKSAGAWPDNNHAPGICDFVLHSSPDMKPVQLNWRMWNVFTSSPHINICNSCFWRWYWSRCPLFPIQSNQIKFIEHISNVYTSTEIKRNSKIYNSLNRQ